MKEARSIREIIEQERGELPETTLHIELYRTCARVDGRSIKQSLKVFTLARIEKVESEPLKGVLEQMVSSMFPETRIACIHSCIGRM